MAEKIGCFIIDLHGINVSPEERDILEHPLVGGIILFTRNYESRKQLQHLCQQIRLSTTRPLLIMVDQEGGRVQRFIDEFTRLPFMAAFGKMYDEKPDVACRLLEDCGWLIATELLSVGIDLNLAPVLDLNKGISNVIGQRAFHSRPQVVVEMASVFIRGMREAGMAATGKHFPGHGSVALDSHVVISIDERSMQEIEQDDMIAFAGVIKSGISAIMAAHIIFPNADTLPVGFSRYWLQDILRDRLGFIGTILSDDLNMQGANISSNYTDRVVAARDAGCDFAMLCNNRQGVTQVLDNLPRTSYWVSKDKWGFLQGDFTKVKQQPFKENKRWQKAHEFLGKITHSMD